MTPSQIKTLAKFEKRILRESLGKAEFRRWFAGSRVVDSKGQPRLMWHGTTKKFDAFDDAFLSSSGTYGPGFYFTNDYALAQEYSEGGTPVGAYLSIQKPWVHDFTHAHQKSFRGLAGKLESLGYDGVIVFQPDDDVVGGLYVEAVALHAEQIYIVSG